MSFSKEKIQSTVTDIVADALDLDPSEVNLHSSLIDDLGAESIDFLDIRYRVNEAFHIKIEDDELWQGFILSGNRDLFSEEGLTEKGLQALKTEMPDFHWERFPDGIREDALPRLITPRTIIECLVQFLRN